MNTHHETDLERAVRVALAQEILQHDRTASRKADATRPDPLSRNGSHPPEAAPVAPPSRRVGFKTILVPTDFSPFSMRAVPYARRFAELFGAELILLHVTDPVTYVPAYCPIDTVDELRNSRLKAAEEELAVLAAAGAQATKCRTMVVDGDAATETDRIARECGADLIVIASHGFTGLKHLLLGSTADKIVRRAPCPVMVIRENAPAPAETTKPAGAGQGSHEPPDHSTSRIDSPARQRPISS